MHTQFKRSFRQSKEEWQKGEWWLFWVWTFFQACLFFYFYFRHFWISKFLEPKYYCNIKKKILFEISILWSLTYLKPWKFSLCQIFTPVRLTNKKNCSISHYNFHLEKHKRHVKASFAREISDFYTSKFCFFLSCNEIWKGNT